MAKKIIATVLAALLIVTVFCSCGGDKGEENKPDNTTTTTTTEPAVVNVDLKNLYDSCTAKMPEMISLDADIMLDYCGIKAEDCVEFYVSICADSLKTDEIWLIKATDEEAVKRITDLANARLKAKGDESITYSPEQYAVVQKAKIVTSGEYFALIVSPDVSEIESIVNNAF